MKKEVKKFLEFNGKTIYFIAVDGQYWIAIKPICAALGVDYIQQFKNLKEDEILGSVLCNHTMQAPDNQLRNYASLPEFYVYGWIFQIQSQSPELLKYKWECYKVLYNHFKGMIAEREQILKVKTLDELEIERLEAELEQSEKYQRIEVLKKRNQQRLAQLRKLDQELVSSQLDLWKTDPSATGKEE